VAHLTSFSHFPESCEICDLEDASDTAMNAIESLNDLIELSRGPVRHFREETAEILISLREFAFGKFPDVVFTISRYAMRSSPVAVPITLDLGFAGGIALTFVEPTAHRAVISACSTLLDLVDRVMQPRRYGSDWPPVHCDRENFDLRLFNSRSKAVRACLSTLTCIEVKYWWVRLEQELEWAICEFSLACQREAANRRLSRNDRQKKKQRDAKLDERDQWLYDRAMEGVQYEKLWRTMPKDRGWRQLSSRNAVRHAVFAYAKRNEKELPPPRHDI
jgi:hypothetical protein